MKETATMYINQGRGGRSGSPTGGRGEVDVCRWGWWCGVSGGASNKRRRRPGTWEFFVGHTKIGKKATIQPLEQRTLETQ